MNKAKITAPEIETALNTASRAVDSIARALDVEYFSHLPRYRRNLSRIADLSSRGSRILDIGSHYLHQSVAMKLLGYNVVGMDVDVFASNPTIVERARRFSIDNRSENNPASGVFLQGEENSFDLILFSEIMEHITFNPILFWKRCYALLKPGGIIYVTTPNSTTLWKMSSVIKNAIFLRGWGTDVTAILSTVTYGHHWKE